MKLHEIIESNKYKIFVDVDGVLADFRSALTKILDQPYDDKKYDTDKAYKSLVWKAIKQYDKEGGKLWANLALMPGTQALWKFLEPYKPEILTATGRSMTASIRQQKHEWLQKHFSGAPVHIVVDGADKQHYAKPNYILIDDKKDNITQWKAAGGIGILHTNMYNTIDQLKKILG